MRPRFLATTTPISELPDKRETTSIPAGAPTRIYRQFCASSITRTTTGAAELAENWKPADPAGGSIHICGSANTRRRPRVVSTLCDMSPTGSAWGRSAAAREYRVMRNSRLSHICHKQLWQLHHPTMA